MNYVNPISLKYLNVLITTVYTFKHEIKTSSIALKNVLKYN